MCMWSYDLILKNARYFMNQFENVRKRLNIKIRVKFIWISCVHSWSWAVCQRYSSVCKNLTHNIIMFHLYIYSAHVYVIIWFNPQECEIFYEPIWKCTEKEKRLSLFVFRRVKRTNITDIFNFLHFVKEEKQTNITFYPHFRPIETVCYSV